MLNKMKKMYKEWKELVNLLAFIVMVLAIILLIDVAPGVSMVMAILLGCICTALGIEE